MAELTNKVEADLVLDRKMDAGRYGGGDLHNYVASQELTVTITLSEYRELVSGIATKDKDISIANDDKYKREQEIREVKAANDTLKAENYDLKVIIDNLRKRFRYIHPDHLVLLQLPIRQAESGLCKRKERKCIICSQLD